MFFFNISVGFIEFVVNMGQLQNLLKPLSSTNLVSSPKYVKNIEETFHDSFCDIASLPLGDSHVIEITCSFSRDQKSQRSHFPPGSQGGGGYNPI